MSALANRMLAATARNPALAAFVSDLEHESATRPGKPRPIKRRIAPPTADEPYVRDYGTWTAARWQAFVANSPSTRLILTLRCTMCDRRYRAVVPPPEPETALEVHIAWLLGRRRTHDLGTYAPLSHWRLAMGQHALREHGVIGIEGRGSFSLASE